MATAHEVQARIDEAQPKLEELHNCVAEAIENAIFLIKGREVCAKRARKIRKRGDHIRYIGRTSTGKARYRWLPAIQVNASS